MRWILAALIIAVVEPVLADEGREAGAGGVAKGSAWVSVGPGGGGHQHWPSISPFDTNLYFVSSDMSGFYRSEDAGRTWRMDAVVRNVTSPAIFHPTDPNLVYVFTFYGREYEHGWRLLRSNDKGKTWQTMREKLEGYDINYGMSLAFDPERPNWLLAGMAGPLEGRILASTDGGRTFAPVPGDVPKEANVYALALDERSDRNKRTVYAGTSEGVYVSADGGSHWNKTDSQPGNGRLSHMVASLNAGKANMVLLAISDPVSPGEWYPGGRRLSKSVDGGKTWEDLTANFSAAIKGRISELRFRSVAIADVRPEVIYASANVQGPEAPWSGEYKSGDGGKTWRIVLPSAEDRDRVYARRFEGTHIQEAWTATDPHFSWGWGAEATYMAVCPKNPDVMIRTDDGRTIGTTDGGANWRQLYSDHVKDNWWASRGLEMVSTYEVYFDPGNHNRMYIAYTDIVFFRSEDRGKSWTYSAHGMADRNTVYELAIDPVHPNVMYAANAAQHDLPQFKMVKMDEKKFTGGVAKTTDGGLNWTMLGKNGGLPQGTCTSILIDPASPPEKRTLLACIIGFGVYKSTDGGEKWRLADRGMDWLAKNANVWRMSMGKDGAIYVAITKNIDRPDGKKYVFSGGTVYRSDDKGESWVRVSPTLPEKASGEANDFAQVWDISASKAQSGLVFVSTFEDRHCGPRVAGGLWASADKGRTWKMIFENEAVNRVSPHPTDPKIIYAGTNFDGLFRTTDGGVTWKKVKGLPFSTIDKVTVDPDDPNTIWVATFGGGTWRGPAAGDDAAPTSP